MKKATLNFQKVAGIAFFILAVTLIIIEPSTIKNPISIDYDKKTFSGTLPVIALIVAAVFFWFGTREKEDELEEAKSALKDAADKLGGKIVTLSFRFGPDDKQEHLKKCYRSNILTGTYSIRNRGVVLKNEKIYFYEEPQSKTIMAEFRDIPFHEDNFIVFEIGDGTNILNGSESLNVRVVNLNH